MRLVHLSRYLFCALFGLLFFVATAVAQVNEIEPNNSPETAQIITLGTEYVGKISSGTPADTGDYFRFSLTSPGNITLRLKPQTAGGSSASSWNIRLFDYATGNELLGFYVDRLDPVGGTTSVGLAAGNYYVRIENNSGVVDVPYLLLVTLATGNYFEQEFNDSPAAAQPISLGVEYLGRLQKRISSSVAEFDYYKFSLTTASSIALHLRPQTAGGSSASTWRVRLRDYATNNALIDFNVGRFDPVGGTKTASLAAGNYYVSIENGSGVIDLPYIVSATPTGFVAPSVPMVEFLHTALNYYFITASPTDIAVLDTVPAFVRTGESFPVYAAPYAGTHGITRFYFDRIAVNQSRGSHFYTSVDSEVAAVAALNPSNMPAPRLPVNEGVNSYAFLPVTAGVCAAGQRPVYRIFRGNARFPDDPNHRFTTSLTIYNNFVALGWDGEGVKFCVPAL